MKTLQILFYLFLIFTSKGIFSQECLSEGIIFTSQIDIDSFPTKYPGCTHILGEVRTTDPTFGSITNLDSLIQIEYIDGDLRIDHDEALISLAGLANLKEVRGDFRLTGNVNLPTLAGLESLTTVHKRFFITTNYALFDLEGLNNLVRVGDKLDISDNQSLANCAGLDNLTVVEGDFTICCNNNLDSLLGLGRLSIIHKRFHLSINDELQYLTGLDSLKTIGQDLRLSSNLSLVNLAGLQNLDSLGSLFVENNFAFQNFNGINNIQTIGHRIIIENNDVLSNLEGLENISKVNNYIKITDNPLLENLDGLQNVVSNTPADHWSWIEITNNPLLTQCDIESVCSYLDIPDRDAIVSNNGIGCNDTIQIKNSCLILATQESQNLQISFFPNPTADFLQVKLDQLAKVEIKLFDSLGQPVFKQKIQSNDQVDISSLANGVYSLVVRNKDDYWIGKVIKISK